MSRFDNFQTVMSHSRVDFDIMIAELRSAEWFVKNCGIYVFEGIEVFWAMLERATKEKKK